jgi:Flp pilus assembly protein TadD
MRSFPLMIIVSVLFVFTVTAQTKLDFDPDDRPAEHKTITGADAGDRRGAVGLNSSGIKLALAGDSERSVQVSRGVARRFPSSFEANFNFGISLAAAGRTYEAVEYLSYATALNERSVDSHNALGEALFKRLDFAKSADEFRRSLDLAPDDPYTANDLAVSLYSSGETTSAVAAANEALRLKPAFPEALNNRGIIRYSLGRFKEARRDFAKAISLKPTYAEAHNNLGVTLSRMRKNKSAHRSFEEALRLHPGWDEAIFNLAINYLNVGMRDEARKCLKSLRALNPELAGKLETQLQRMYVIEVPKNVPN